MCPTMETGLLVRRRTERTDTKRAAWRRLEGVVQSERRAPRPASHRGTLWRMSFTLDKTDSVVFPQLVGKPLLLGNSMQQSLC